LASVIWIKSQADKITSDSLKKSSSAVRGKFNWDSLRDKKSAYKMILADKKIGERKKKQVRIVNFIIPNVYYLNYKCKWTSLGVNFKKRNPLYLTLKVSAFICHLKKL
jgi:hypothetical protein